MPDDNQVVPYRSRSLWLDDLADDLTPRAGLPGDIDVDVAIVGGGYTGLWAAYYLKSAEPTLRVAVLEREICGFGAAGRNAGFCAGHLPGGAVALRRRYGRDAVRALRNSLVESVDEVARVVRVENIEAQLLAGGLPRFVTTPAHLTRAVDDIEAQRRAWGDGPEDLRWLRPSEAAELVGARGVLGARLETRSSTLHPARLVRGLARVVEGLGVKVFEHVTVQAIESRLASTTHGRVKADVVVRATEGYTSTLPGVHRSLAPIYSYMIATEPLPPSFWAEVPWQLSVGFADYFHSPVFARRSHDGRIVMGGRASRYPWKSRVTHAFDDWPFAIRQVRQAIAEYFPAAANARITHTWGGPLGMARDLANSVALDRSTGLAHAGGHGGSGIAAANLAGRTVADLVLEHETQLTTLAWVGHQSRPWEPEPLRWLGITATRNLARHIDRWERRNGSPAIARGRLLARFGI